MYLFCLVVGGGLLLLGLLGSDLHADVHTEISPEVPLWGDLAGWLSLRVLVSFVAFFGLGGLAAGGLGFSPSGQLAFALLCGLLVGGIAATLSRLARERGNLVTQAAPLVGRVCQVVVPNSSGSGEVGKLEVTVAGQREQRLFRSRDLLRSGDQALIIAEQGGLLEVARWEAA